MYGVRQQLKITCTAIDFCVRTGCLIGNFPPKTIFTLLLLFDYNKGNG